jgi:hypothetical protein
MSKFLYQYTPLLYLGINASVVFERRMGKSDPPTVPLEVEN